MGIELWDQPLLEEANDSTENYQSGLTGSSEDHSLVSTYRYPNTGTMIRSMTWITIVHLIDALFSALPCTKSYILSNSW